MLGTHARLHKAELACRAKARYTRRCRAQGRRYTRKCRAEARRCTRRCRAEARRYTRRCRAKARRYMLRAHRNGLDAERRQKNNYTDKRESSFARNVRKHGQIPPSPAVFWQRLGGGALPTPGVSDSFLRCAATYQESPGNASRILNYEF